VKAIFQFFIDNAKLTVVITLFFMLAGTMGLLGINSESYPNVNFATATIVTRYEGATPEDIETKITKKIEDKIKTVSGLKDVKSISQPGLSTIVVRVDMDNEVVDEVMSDLQKAVESVNDLPDDLRDDPVFTEINSEEFPAIEIAVIGTNENRKRDLFAEALRDDLEDNKRVSAVRMVGFSKREFRVKLNLKSMDSYYIGVNEIIQQLAARNVNIPGGSIADEKGGDQLIRFEGKVKNKEDLESILIRANFNGQKIYLRDLATVVDSAEDPEVLSKLNGEEATLLIVNKKGGADTLKLVDEVNQVLAVYQQKKGSLNLLIYANEAEKVKQKLSVLSSNAISGLVLVVIILLIFLPGKVGLMASLSLPIALMGTFALLPPFGMNLNTITILALVIALGMLVDNAVVIAENFNRLVEEGTNPKEAALNSVLQLWVPITATALTTIAAFLPMLVTKGVMGEFIKYIPIVVTTSLVLSLLESFLLLPMRLAWTGSPKKQQKEDWFNPVIKRFESFVRYTILRRYQTAMVCSLLIIGSMYLAFGVNKFVLFPSEQTEIYLARLEMPIGTPVEKTLNAVTRVATEVQSVLGTDVESVVVRAGLSSMGPTDSKGKTGEHTGLILIYVTKEASFSLTHIDALKKLRTIDKGEFELLSFEELVNGPPVGEPINGTFRSHDAVQLKNVTEKIRDDMAKIPGVFDLSFDDEKGNEEIHAKINYEEAARLGLTMQNIAQTTRSLFKGERVSNVNLKNKEVDILIEVTEDQKVDREQLSKIQLMDGQGNLIPLGQVAKFTQQTGSDIIKRYDFKRSRTLLGNIEENVINSHQANLMLKELFQKNQALYPDVSLVFGGEEESTNESMQSLFQALILSLVGIFGLLVFIFRSYLRPLIIMTTIPFGLVGFSIAFYFHGKYVSFMAMIGLIGLAGIIVNSGIVLISFIDQLRAETDWKLEDILVKASGMRLRAVVVTSLTTIIGLLPTAYGIGGTDAMLIPMTMALAWGLTSATLLTLVWIPSGYAILEDMFSFGKNATQKILKTINNRKSDKTLIDSSGK
jgi:multidrug efflux pump subunit AcrB